MTQPVDRLTQLERALARLLAQPTDVNIERLMRTQQLCLLALIVVGCLLTLLFFAYV